MPPVTAHFFSTMAPKRSSEDIYDAGVAEQGDASRAKWEGSLALVPYVGEKRPTLALQHLGVEDHSEEPNLGDGHNELVLSRTAYGMRRNPFDRGTWVHVGQQAGGWLGGGLGAAIGSVGGAGGLRAGPSGGCEAWLKRWRMGRGQGV